MTDREGWATSIKVDEIRKGDAISSHNVAVYLGIPENDVKAMQLGTLQLCQWLATELAARNYPCTVVVRGGDIVVLTDAEAVAYNTRRARAGIDIHKRANGRLKDVDTRQLDWQQQRSHERALWVQGIQIQALETAKKQVRAADRRVHRPSMLV